MEFSRQLDGSLKPLPVQCVDTGMGLERLSAVMQGASSNYESDAFTHIINRTREIVSTRTGKSLPYITYGENPRDPSYVRFLS